MFALEINFQDGVSQSETILIRRPQALIGSSDYAHVVVDDLKSLGCQLRLVRDLARQFRCKPVGARDDVNLQVLEGVYNGEASFDLGPVKFHVTALDTDLLVREGEPPDRAGVRVLRQACARTGPRFPAVVVRGAMPMVVSFVPDQPLYIGRSSQCALRLDSADISAKHARIGYESGKFWIEDLGSTNGTFVNQKQISGRVALELGVPVILGREISILGVMSEDQIDHVAHSPERTERPAAQEHSYPVLVSVSELVRPARVVVPLGGTVQLGRDHRSDMWLGVPEVSREHCSIELSKTGALWITDHSRNGTICNGDPLVRGERFEVGALPRVLEFGSGVTVAVCFDREQEKQFVASQGAADVFLEEEDEVGAEGSDYHRDLVGGPGTITEFGFVARLLRMYRSQGTLGKLALLGVVPAVLVVVLVVLSLLRPLVF